LIFLRTFFLIEILFITKINIIFINNLILIVAAKLLQSLLHIVPFCEGKNKKPEGFAKQKQLAVFVM
jgi:hypothetical protein